PDRDAPLKSQKLSPMSIAVRRTLMLDKILFGSLLQLYACSAFAQSYARCDPSPGTQLDGSETLRIVKKDGTSVEAPKVIDDSDGSFQQVGFDSCTVAKDGSTVGWLALTDGYGQSYPGAQFLVIFQEDQILRLIPGRSAIFYWEFRNNGREVAYVAGYYHFITVESAVLQRISDGTILGEYSW